MTSPVPRLHGWSASTPTRDGKASRPVWWTTWGLVAYAVLAGCMQPTSPASDVPRPRPFESPVIFAGDSWSYTFTTAGVRPYMCHPHTEMRGAVIVDPASTVLNATVEMYQETDGMGFRPANVTIAPGGRVTWVNPGRAAHSLMAEEEMVH